MGVASEMIKTEAEIDKMRVSAHLVAEAIELAASLLKPGATTKQLNDAAEEFIFANGGYPAFKGYKVGKQVYKFAACISTNEAVVHGLPNDTPLREGDIVSIDIGVEKDGWYGDGAWTYAVGQTKPEWQKLMDVTRESLLLGVAQARVGAHLYDISKAIEDYCLAHGYGIVRELVGHGIGRHLHEEPQVPNFVPGRFDGNYPNIELKEGMTFAIEPMVNLGTGRVKTAKDKWTILTADNKPSAHYEHTIVVRPGRGEILTK
jgi:methionyl aminopeptidase